MLVILKCTVGGQTQNRHQQICKPMAEDPRNSESVLNPND